ncbi:MAG: hypothetical protein ACTSVK_18200, partial [Promethearchaeota archaeon]
MTINKFDQIYTKLLEVIFPPLYPKEKLEYLKLPTDIFGQPRSNISKIDVIKSFKRQPYIPNLDIFRYELYISQLEFIKREILPKLAEKKPVYLYGHAGTGKTWLVYELIWRYYFTPDTQELPLYPIPIFLLDMNEFQGNINDLSRDLSIITLDSLLIIENMHANRDTAIEIYHQYINSFKLLFTSREYWD